MATVFALSSEYIQELKPLLPDVELERVRFKQGTFIGRVFGWFNQWAVTFGRSVHLTPRAPVGAWSQETEFWLYAHECYHVKQYSKIGLLPYLFLYILCRVVIFVLRRPIYDHPFEMPAYDFSRLARDRWRERHPASP